MKMSNETAAAFGAAFALLLRDHCAQVGETLTPQTDGVAVEESDAYTEVCLLAPLGTRTCDLLFHAMREKVQELCE